MIVVVYIVLGIAIFFMGYLIGFSWGYQKGKYER